MFYVYPKNNKKQKTFEKSCNIFVSFLSVIGCSISVRVKFANEKGSHKQAKTGNGDDSSSSEDEMQAASKMFYSNIEETLPEGGALKKLHKMIYKQDKEYARN